MKRWILSCLLVVFAGCGNDSNPNPGLSEGNNTSGTIQTDYCEEFGWYGDGKCDEFCKRPDPDCSSGPSNNNGGPPPGPGPTPVPEPDDPPQVCDDVSWDRDYVGTIEECADIDFACVDGWTGFEDQCGCGCELLPGTGPTCQHLWERGDVTFIETDPDACAAIRFTCADGEEAFSDECGCGCIEPWNGGPVACLADGPDVERFADPLDCTMIDFDTVCDEGWTFFQDDCSCGCRLVCSDDFECPSGYCENQRSSVEPMCIYPNCDDGSELICDGIIPACYDGEVMAVIGGCWECRDARTCGPSMGP